MEVVPCIKLHDVGACTKECINVQRNTVDENSTSIHIKII